MIYTHLDATEFGGTYFCELLVYPEDFVWSVRVEHFAYTSADEVTCVFRDLFCWFILST
jgi:hypothetical protein